MLLNVLITILIVEVIISFIIFKSDLIAPAFIFSIVFFVAAINLSFYVDYWKVNISETTIWVVGGGVAAFIVGCLLIKFLEIGGNILNIRRKIVYKEFRLIEIDRRFLVVGLVIYIIIEVVMLFFVRKIALENGGSGSILSLIGYYNNLAKSGGQYSMPTIVNLLVVVCINMGYVWGYILVNNYIYQKKTDKYIIALLVLSCLCGMISGSRADLIMIMCGIAIIYILMIRKKNKDRLIKIPVKSMIIAILALCLVIKTFQSIGTLLGRDAYIYQSNEYLAIYISGPLLNLNNCIIKGMKEPLVWGHETFPAFNNIINQVTNGYQGEITTSRQYYQANFHNTGNVCTAFYDFYHDFGLVGCFVLAFIMGAIAQAIYSKAKKSIMEESGISTMVIFYSLVLFLVARSFFANAFYAVLCSLHLFKVLIMWMVSSRLLERIKIKF